MRLDEPIPWPVSGSVLVPSSASDWWNNACVNFAPPSFFLHARGYWTAADRLVQSVIEDRRDQDFLVHPIFFLYRQAVELDLKSVVSLGRQVLDRTGAPLHKTHDLTRLWAEASELLNEIEPKGKDDVGAAGELILQLANIDPDGQRFRYPLHTSGAPSLDPALTVINVRHASELMAGVQSFFDACGTALSVYLDRKLEYQRAHDP